MFFLIFDIFVGISHLFEIVLANIFVVYVRHLFFLVTAFHFPVLVLYNISGFLFVSSVVFVDIMPDFATNLLLPYFYVWLVFLAFLFY